MCLSTTCVGSCASCARPCRARREALGVRARRDLHAPRRLVLILAARDRVVFLGPRNSLVVVASLRDGGTSSSAGAEILVVEGAP